MRQILLAAICAGALLGPVESASPESAVRDCSAPEVRRVVTGFVRAFDAGNRARLDASFARDDGDGDAATPSFQWYSTGPPGARFGRDAQNRATLVRYFLARHRRGERLRLVALSGGGNANGYFHFGFHVHRQARDLRRPGVFEGKGAAICLGSRVQIAVWSLGGRVPSG